MPQRLYRIEPMTEGEAQLRLARAKAWQSQVDATCDRWKRKKALRRWASKGLGYFLFSLLVAAVSWGVMASVQWWAR